MVNISSISGHVGIPSIPQASYAASKLKLSGLTVELAVQWAKHSIRVNTVAPGFFRSGVAAPLYDDERVRSDGRGPLVDHKRVAGQSLHRFYVPERWRRTPRVATRIDSRVDGYTRPRLLPNPSVTTLREDGRVIAGIGCSGATNEAEDKVCAHAARDAFAT